MPRTWLLGLLLMFPAAGAAPMLWAVAPDLPGPGPGDEAFALWLPEAQDLSGWTVTDGEGTWPLSGTYGAGVHWYAGDPELWMRFDMPEARPFTQLRLGNQGDDLALVDPDGAVADAFAWGDGTHPGITDAITYRSPGLVYRRDTVDDAPVDTDHADDWRTPRTYRVGQSTLDAPLWDVDRATLYLSPDTSHGVLTDLLAGARHRVALHVYGLRSPTLTDALADAARRVPTDVLVTASPVGMGQGDRSATGHALQRIQEAGGAAWLAQRGRYDFHHLKVLVVDDAVAIQSENWVRSGVPEDPSWGNRGWGIVLHDAEAAQWFDTWMAADRAAWDTVAFDLATFAPAYREPVRFPPRAGEYASRFEATVLEGLKVRPVVSPDHTGDPRTDPVAAIAGEARSRLFVQQLDVSVGAANDLGWHAPDPLAESVVAAARAGADVRVHAAAPFSGRDTDNAEALERLSARAAVHVSQETPPGIATLHNKGIVADDAVVVGSMNGNHHSRSENREVGVVVLDARAADWYAQVFLADWPRAWPATEVSSIPVPFLLVVLALGSRWWPSTGSHGSPSR